MKILNGAEQMLFDRPPQLSSAARRRVFELPVAVWSVANDIAQPFGRNQMWLPRGGADLTCGDSISNLTSR
jgi:hypothetical protein